MGVVEDTPPIIRINKQHLAAPIKSAVDKFQLLPEFLKVRGLVKQHLDSFNYFIETGIKKVVHANNIITSIVDPGLYLKYTDVRIGDPSIKLDHAVKQLTPHMCRLSDITYAASILVDIEYTTGAGVNNLKRKVERKNVEIGRLPIMLRSHKCILYGKDEAELAKLRECPLDPGGYFVVKGTEKVVLIQEQLSKNRIIIDSDRKGRLMASVTSSTEVTKSKTNLIMDKEKIYLELNAFEKVVPIMVVMKAMGMESDQEVVQMLGRDPRYATLLLPSIQECVKENVHTQQQALEFLDKRVRKFLYNSNVSQEGRALIVLRDVFIANVPVHQHNFRPKCMYVAVMLRRMMEAYLNKDAMDDKDYVGNKRLELSGQLISLLFEDLFKTANSDIKKRVDAVLAKRSTQFDFLQYIKGDIITRGLENAMATGNWDLKRFKMHRKGMTQVLARLSFIASLGHMTKIQPQFEKSRKVSGPRALQPSQWGMLCPCDTPEGESCGLVKNLALMTHVTTDEEDGPLVSLCRSLGVEDLELMSGEELHSANSFLVICNGLILGKHRKPQHFANALRKLRRAGRIGDFVSVFVNEKQRCVYIASDGGRVCRPLVVADKGVSRIKEHHMKELRDGARTFNDFLREGLIEYLDVNEQNNALIALYDGEAEPETTHIEIEPFTILGVCAGLIPFPHHNQSPRNTYQCAMGKQAMGNIAYNQLYRMDSLLYLLVYPQRPLLTTKTIELVGYDKLGAGQNATVAVMSYSGYDIEDAIVMNKASLDRGFGRCIVMKKLSAVCQKYPNNTMDRIVRPQRVGRDAERTQLLDDDGLASPGEIIRPYDIYINKQSPINTKSTYESSKGLPDNAYKPSIQTYKGARGETAVVDRVQLNSDKDNNLCFRFIIRHTRRPEVGDKFSSRHGQKGVCGTIIQQEDFPFSERGICPDLIMNPHGFPSRMTIGKMIELLGGKAGVSCGRFHYGSAFGEPSGHADRVEAISETLVKNGFSYSGKDFIYSGITGCPLQAYIFMGPIYYQKLKHMVLDKMHARARGPRVMLTRQPTEGRSRDGGLRLGEMERDCLIAYGASMLIFERLMISSDPFEVQNGLDTKVEKSRKQLKERKNRGKKIRGVKKTKVGDAAKAGKKNGNNTLLSQIQNALTDPQRVRRTFYYRIYWKPLAEDMDGFAGIEAEYHCKINWVIIARQFHFNYATPDRSGQEMLRTMTPLPTEHWPFASKEEQRGFWFSSPHTPKAPKHGPRPPRFKGDAEIRQITTVRFQESVLTSKSMPTRLPAYRNQVSRRDYAVLYSVMKVEGLMQLMEGEHVGPFNLGNPGEFTMMELAHVVQETIDPNARIEFWPNTEDDLHKRKPDTTMAKELLGNEPPFANSDIEVCSHNACVLLTNLAQDQVQYLMSLSKEQEAATGLALFRVDIADIEGLPRVEYNDRSDQNLRLIT
ncbi:hypothetical protein IFM89_014703 [Coptis chinensis]|uniref:DNA-directed RNA polymerase subunit beta n=1 Tax=Coptis chinensis TaxID=261450 RepID=A0A835HEJ0_9MAGN|nr:hypothetical protein IFM89_014703 [Coptis chinensis]